MSVLITRELLAGYLDDALGQADIAQIEQELRTQYLASYTPTNNKLDGGYRKLDVACQGDGLKIQTRKGYYAMGEPQ